MTKPMAEFVRKLTNKETVTLTECAEIGFKEAEQLLRAFLYEPLSTNPDKFAPKGIWNLEASMGVSSD